MQGRGQVRGGAAAWSQAKVVAVSVLDMKMVRASRRWHWREEGRGREGCQVLGGFSLDWLVAWLAE